MAKPVIRFGIMADVHQDLMFNAEKRLQEFILRMNAERVDFIIQLGDFCHPIPENGSFLSIWNEFNGPRYHVLGNHDMDKNDKKTVMSFIGMDRSYYSFDRGPYHFVVLDANYIKLEDREIDYEFGNYVRHPGHIDHISAEQLEWLGQDLAGTNKPTFIFSHQNLDDSELGIKNGEQVRAILRTANEAAGFRKVVACLNGHNHLDGVKVIDDIYYIHINSMSYYYMGPTFNVIRYSEALTRKYPILAQSAPYEDPLYAIVTLEPGLLTIEGKESGFVGPAPIDCGHVNTAGGHRVTANISRRQLKY
ncbi:metallophosphoesterase family protein [Paenibacillus oceani]|uniref:Metallophosphoesterase n=1 Tax=Paenibacillus oceani TaxID=2772510 RepID=A0A927CH36_9BACL|nr:metallophosphoesterase [Paenibacillus oceani]MBD2866482.1 metallophosphoesterase [Paenibacillus oceani]